MSDDAKPEAFALARRGLPLVSPTRAPLRGAWLPSAVRNPAAASPAAPTVAEPAAPIPGEEPWWMEAAEWVPREKAEAEVTQSAPVESDTAGRSSQPASENSSSSPRPRTAPAPQPNAAAEAPRHESMGTVAGRESARSSPALPAAPERASSVTTIKGNEAARDDIAPPRAAIEADSAAAAQSPALHDAVRTAPADASPIALRTEVPTPIARVTTEKFPPAAPSHVARTHAMPAPIAPLPEPRTAMPAQVQPLANANRPAAPPLQVDVGTAQSKAAPADAPQPAAPQPHTMGSPHAPAARQAQLPAHNGDIASLLASTGKPSAPQIRIDRIAVTVQAPAPTAAPPAAPRADAAAVRSAAPAPAFRNPWSGYHARRD